MFGVVPVKLVYVCKAKGGKCKGSCGALNANHKKKGCVRFLCKEHHDELDSYKKKHKSKKSKEKIKEFKSKLIN